MKNYSITINGRSYDVEIGSIDDKNASVTVNGIQYDVEYEAEQKSEECITPEVLPNKTVQAVSDGHETVVKSPLPGVVVEIDVKPGEQVRDGQTLAVLEAMKMENEIQAPCSGIIKEIRAAKGDSVPEGEVLMTINAIP